MRVTILGSGTPTPTPERFGSAYVADFGARQLMFDCGPAATHKLVRAGYWPTDISHLFFTHHHFDHDVDYPCFLLCRWDQGAGREQPLEVIGPRYTEEITEGLIGGAGVFRHDVNARIHAPPSQQVFLNRGGELPRQPPSVQAQDIGAGYRHIGADWEVQAAEAKHVQPYLDSVAYRLNTEEGSVVFTGDTEPCDSVTKLAAGADLLVCMCWDEDDRMMEMGEDTGQCGPRGAAIMAAQAGVRALLLVHSGPALDGEKGESTAVSTAREFFDGRVVMGRELQGVSVE